MKSLAYLLLLLFFVLGCSNSKKIVARQDNAGTICLHEGSWVSNFKDEVFIACLKKLYPTDFKQFYDSNDASSAANDDWLQYNRQVRKTIDSVAENFMKRPEANWEIEGGKITMNVCLDFRLSHELDSIAMKYYSFFIKNNPLSAELTQGTVRKSK